MSDPAKRPLRIGLAGLGTVGAGVVKMVQTHAELIAARAGRPLQIVAVSARSRAKDRGVDLSGYAWEDDAVALARREDVDVFVEVMGGENGPAKAGTEAAIAAGKPVVSANKALLARHGQALAEKAEAAGVTIRYEAAVAGGIPVIKALGEGLAGNGITRVMGVMNGTCNYILTEMEKTGADYADVLADAQRLGYAEADPSFDVGGIDAAHKLALLSALAFGTKVDFDGVAIEGIERITLPDIEQAADMGYRIKLLGVARMNADGLEQRMQPCLVPLASPVGQLDGVTNAVVIEGDFIKGVTLQGPGAGEGPTASAILGDLIDIARGLTVPAFGQPAASLKPAPRSAGGAAAAWYIRILLRDAPGMLARVATVLGGHEISIDMMRQYGHEGDGAPVVIVTHPADTARMQTALAEIDGLEVSLAAPVALRIETL
ncbi:homoserine dehydrogenase [Oceanicella sp. SM1341]|uniref:homoserine dehydrogenase n=1 Tax=Oceanicella sp. SM1341 TaxID=1548889 RepID=UPI000E49D35C|nr:homoserine dehydrogenase [Oceanicella sp. SM1341]